jgi:hypothetical protein
MYETSNDDKLKEYIRFVIRSINALKFAVEWKAKSSEPGGKAWKKEYRVRLYEMTLKKRETGFEILGEAARKEKKKQFQQFVRRHEKVITARNQLLTLYRTVFFI